MVTRIKTHNMAKKIEGWADVHIRDGVTEGWFGEGLGGLDNYPLATLTLHDGDNRERIYTEGEVKVILEEIVKHVEGYYFDRAEIAGMVGKHGIVLDSA